MLSWLQGLLRSGARRGRTFLVPMRLRAKYDAAQTTPENTRHWANADGLSANAANSPQVRRTLRNRTRYEVTNNSFAKGIVGTLANDTIATGPRLQMLTSDAQANRVIEKEFARWAKAVCLAEKLRTMRMAKTEDGEAFAVLTNNPKLPTRVNLDVRLVEADQVATPLWTVQTGSSVDGIVFDEFGNPVEYHILKRHPGDTAARFSLDFDRLPAESVIHYFRADRPGQARGVPELTPSLPLFAYLRRYVLAVILGAETAANFAAVLKTNAPASGESAEVEPNAVIELERNSITAVPEGWDISQIRAEQPTATFGEFFDKIINWIARCVSMPFNIAACDSSKYNYASGRLDHQTYDLSLRVERSVLESLVLDRILHAWLQEAVLLEGYLPRSARGLNPDYEHQWFWDGREHVDPAKEATAQATRLENHTTTLAEEYARRGRDWEAELRQRAKEVALMEELGLQPAQAVPAPVTDMPEEDDRAAA